jgi:hypothetical protein
MACIDNNRVICYQMSFLFLLLSFTSLENHYLIIFVVDISTLVFFFVIKPFIKILFTFNFILHPNLLFYFLIWSLFFLFLFFSWTFCKYFIVFNFILQFKFMIYYIFQSGLHSSNYFSFQFHPLIENL